VCIRWSNLGMLGKVTEILGLLWFLPIYDYLTREKEILMLCVIQ
jgi:hypothetical protein